MTKVLKVFKDKEKGILWHNFKKHNAIFVYDTLDEKSFDYLTQNLSKINKDAIEVTFDVNNKKILAKAKQNEFIPLYHWYNYMVSEKDLGLSIDSNIYPLKNRRLVKKQLTDQVHELAKRDPSMFDENGEEKGWYKAGKKCIVYKINNEIISILTYQVEPKNNNLHIYLTYTLPEHRSKGYNSKLFDYIKKYAAEKQIKSITICTDVTKQNRTPNMFLKNDFKYSKTGFAKILKNK